DHEDRRWIAAGLAKWIEHSSDNESEHREQKSVAAQVYAESGLSRKDLDQWASFEEAVGTEEAAILVWIGLRELEKTMGSEGISRLARATVIQRVSRVDSRAMWWDLLHPVDRAFATSTGMDLDQFFDRWVAALEELQPSSEASEDPETVG
ncbi:MAG: hypothetical protein AAF236_09690, partial [Verrucomicrobiota bacterium]